MHAFKALGSPGNPHGGCHVLSCQALSEPGRGCGSIIWMQVLDLKLPFHQQIKYFFLIKNTENVFYNPK